MSWNRFVSFFKACMVKSNCSLVNKHRKLHCSLTSNKNREGDMNLFMSDRAALTSARTTGNGIYCPPKLQASLDQQSGMIRLFLIVIVKCYDCKYIQGSKLTPANSQNVSDFDNLRVRKISTSKRLRVRIIHVSQTKGNKLLVVSPVC